MKTTLLFLSCCVALVVMTIAAPPASAYETYSEGLVAHPPGSDRCRTTDAAGCEESYGNCKTCHGNFRATNADVDENGEFIQSRPMLRDEYVSLADGNTWNVVFQSADASMPPPTVEVGLHDIHRHVMLDEDGAPSACDVCHSGPRSIVYLSYSNTTWFDGQGISCVGCHGRMEDQNNGAGLGAGLRQHHTNAGINECKTCHEDANPANYTPVGENVLPPYYGTPDPDDVFLNKPTDPCNPHGEENYAGGRSGLDNDGDGVSDKQDSDCRPIGAHNNHGRDNDDDHHDDGHGRRG